MQNLNEMMNAIGRITDKRQDVPTAMIDFCDSLADHGIQAHQEWRVLAGRMEMHDFKDLPLLMDGLNDYLQHDGKALAMRDLMETIQKRSRYAYMDWECLQEALLYLPVEASDMVDEEVAA